MIIIIIMVAGDEGDVVVVVVRVVGAVVVVVIVGEKYNVEAVKYCCRLRCDNDDDFRLAAAVII